MNFNIKTRILASPAQSIAAGTPLTDIIGDRGRLLGIVLYAVNAADVVTFQLFESFLIGVVDIPVASANVTRGAAADSRAWWSGLRGQYKDHAVPLAVAANSVNGFYPLTCPSKKPEFSGALAPQLTITVTITGSAGAFAVFYYTDENPANNAGEHV